MRAQAVVALAGLGERGLQHGDDAFRRFRGEVGHARDQGFVGERRLDAIALAAMLLQQSADRRTRVGRQRRGMDVPGARGTLHREAHLQSAQVAQVAGEPVVDDEAQGNPGDQARGVHRDDHELVGFAPEQDDPGRLAGAACGRHQAWEAERMSDVRGVGGVGQDDIVRRDQGPPGRRPPGSGRCAGVRAGAGTPVRPRRGADRSTAVHSNRWPRRSSRTRPPRPWPGGPRTTPRSGCADDARSPDPQGAEAPDG